MNQNSENSGKFLTPGPSASYSQARILGLLELRRPETRRTLLPRGCPPYARPQRISEHIIPESVEQSARRSFMTEFLQSPRWSVRLAAVELD